MWRFNPVFLRFWIEILFLRGKQDINPFFF